jgi:hypothetical protein|tara:strand:- start:2855 stop:3028 length:174 start_codon:yes stop_codon:yes gene_type:complete
MTYDEQADAFALDLESLIYRYTEEFDLLEETMIGVLINAATRLAQPVEWDLGDEMLD